MVLVYGDGLAQRVEQPLDDVCGLLVGIHWCDICH